MSWIIALASLARSAFARLPRPVWLALAALLALAGVWHWHEARVRAAFTAGSVAQGTADRAATRAASAAAARAQHDLAAALAVRQATITKGTADALAARTADLARRYDDLRVRWAAARADRGGPGDDGAAAVPDAAGAADGTACAAAGWVSFDTAAAAAHAADAAIAKDDAWIDWAAAQQAAWPR